MHPSISRQDRRAALRAAFPLTTPILAGFIFLGITCGIYSTSLGLPWWVPSLMACVIFAGSAEFIVASMLTAPFDPISTFALVFIVNARHLFYGLSMLECFRNLGRKRPYLVFAMCDETFSINYSAPVPEGVDRGWFMAYVSLLNHLYWIIGCTLGGAFGSVAAMQVRGVSFAMTALFVVIFVDQWFKDSVHASEVIGVAASLAALLAFGADGFMIPAMILILLSVSIVRRWLEPKLDEAADGGARRTDADEQPARNAQDGTRSTAPDASEPSAADNSSKRGIS